MKKRETKALKKITSRTIILFILVLTIIYLAFSIGKSLIVKRPDRINIFKYDENSSFYSISTKDTSNYIVRFRPDLKMLVPGGYGYYRVGALGKLVKLEKNKNLLQRTISYSTSSFVDKYFYPNSSKIYYDSESKNNIELPSFKELFLYKSNSSFWDRVYLFTKFLFIKKNKISFLNTYESIDNNKEKVFDKELFDKEYNGIFFQKTYRDEKKTVQILYSKNYDSAFIINQILEGNGIRVVDILQKKDSPKKCKIIENLKDFSKTTKDISFYFNCIKKSNKSEISDIIFVLGDLENKWSLK